MWNLLTGGLKFIFKGVAGILTGGTLDSILKTIENNLDNEVEKEKIKGEVTKKWIDRQADLLVGRTWWFQIFFVIPLGVWWTAVILDSIFGWDHNIAALPAPLDDWAGAIISALFIVDGSKALLGGVKASFGGKQ